MTWWRDGVVYQVYPRSFADSDGDGVGDLPGLTARLDHIAGLGVDAVWVTPFQRSPQTDHGYDVSDYRDVDPLFGTLADFGALVARAHELGLRLIIDLVPNHCSVEHPLFQAALAGRDRDLFHFADRPGNWPSVFGGPAWTRVADGQWYLHLYAPEQPDWNWRNPRVPAYFEKILKFWYDRGADGVRIDVAHGLFKAPGLPDLADPDIPTGRLRANPHACDQEEVHAIYRSWRRIADSYEPPRALIGEVNLAAHRAARYTRPDELHQAFAFAFLIAPWDAHAWRDAADELLVHPPVTWVTENHDVTRTPTRYGNAARARAALLTILALPGAAYVYQGQELGLPEVDVPPSARQDPAWARAGTSRDGCRVPLPWRRDPSGTYGFSPPDSAPPWLPVPSQWGSYAGTADLSRTAIQLRRRLHHDGTLTADDDVAFSIDGDDRLIARRGRFTLVVAMGSAPVALPPGSVALTSDPLTADGRLPVDAAAWLLADTVI